MKLLRRVKANDLLDNRHRGRNTTAELTGVRVSIVWLKRGFDYDEVFVEYLVPSPLQGQGTSTPPRPKYLLHGISPPGQMSSAARQRAALYAAEQLAS